MATPIKIVVHFDDGTTTEFSVRGMSSIFLKEAAAVKCGHRPPYKQGPPPNGGNSGSMTGEVTLMATAEGGDNGGGDSRSGDTCFWVNGVIICP